MIAPKLAFDWEHMTVHFPARLAIIENENGDNCS